MNANVNKIIFLLDSKCYNIVKINLKKKSYFFFYEFCPISVFARNIIQTKSYIT